MNHDRDAERDNRVPKSVPGRVGLRHSAATRGLGVALALVGAWATRSLGADDPRIDAPSPGQVADTSTAAVTEQADALKKEQYAIASRLLKEYPDDFHAWRVMGYVHSSHGNLDEMYRCWERCRQLNPNRADIYDQLGRHAVQTEQYEAAIGYWRQALSIDPKFPGVHRQIGYALLNLGRPQDATSALQQEIDLAPTSSQAHYLLGEALFQLDDFAAAKVSYQRAVQLEPSHSHAYYGLIKTCKRLGQDEEAASYAKEFQRLETAAARSDTEARRTYDDLQQMRERLAVTLVDAGQVYRWHKKPRQAEWLWKRAAAVDPTSTSCRSSLAALYLEQGKAPEALRQFVELARLEPRNADTHQRIGLLHARMGNLASAESALKTVVELAPENAGGYRMLAKFYLNTNRQSARAQELARAAVHLEPVAESYFVLGWASAKNGKLPEAEAALTKAIRLEPDNAVYRKLYDMIHKRE